MSIEVLIRIILILLYLPTCLLVFWRLFPRLSSTSRRLAVVMLASQVLVIALALESWTLPYRIRILWGLDYEWNIPTTLASTQLALVSGAALLTALLVRARPRWFRLYFIGLGLVFLFLALDEFFDPIRPYLARWELYYAVFGAAVVAATLIVAARSPRRMTIWHICLVAGLALSAVGALVIEQFRFQEICGNLGFWHNGVCRIHVIEETLEFLGIWLALIAVLGQLSDAVPRPGRLTSWLLYFLPLAWIAIIPAPREFGFLEWPAICLALIAAINVFFDAASWRSSILRLLTVSLLALWLIITYLPSLFSLIEFHILAAPATVTYESGWELRVFHIDHGENAATIQLFAAVESWQQYTGLGYSLHLVDQVSGSSAAGTDSSAKRQHQLPHGPLLESYIYKQWLELNIPSEAPRNRAYWLVLTSWRETGDEYVRQRITSSDYHPLLDDTQIILGELVIPEYSTLPKGTPIAAFENGLFLQAVSVPASAIADKSLAIDFSWRSDADALEDYSQFLHLVNTDTGDWWGFDQSPLGLRMPTRLWYDGMSDSQTWEITPPADLAQGSYTLFTGLYHTTDLQRLPAFDADGSPFVDARVPVGTITIQGS